jgi:glycosyltransferase involved in cell wall biosynthesis
VAAGLGRRHGEKGSSAGPFSGVITVTVKLSALVCAHNEEQRLAACLQRLRFADEVVVVLDRCTDRSAEIARLHADRVVTGTFPLEGPRRAAGVEACTGDWILEIDADEVVSAALAEEVRHMTRSAITAAHFLIPIDNYVGDRLIRHGWGGSFGTSAVARLYRRGCKRWNAQRVHPGVVLEGSSGGRLLNPIIHHVDDDVSDMLRRLDRYTDLRARDLIDEGRVGSLGGAALRGLRRFWKCYVRRKGYREGRWGVLIAVMAGLFAFLSVLRAQLLLADLAAPVPGVGPGSSEVAAE